MGVSSVSSNQPLPPLPRDEGYDGDTEQNKAVLEPSVASSTLPQQPISNAQLKGSIQRGLAIAAPQLKQRSAELRRIPPARQEKSSVQFGLLALSKAASKGILVETRNTLNLSFLEQTSVIAGTIANMIGTIIGLARIPISIGSLWLGTSAYKEAKRTLEDCDTTIDFSNGKIANATTLKAAAQSNPNHKFAQAQIKAQNSAIDDHIRVRETAVHDKAAAVKKMTSAKISILIGSASLAVGLFFAAGSILKLTADLAYFGARVAVNTKTLSLVGTAFITTASGIGILIATVNIALLGKAISNDNKKIAELEKRQNNIDSLQSKWTGKNANGSSPLIQQFYILENKKLTSERREATEQHSLHLLSMAVNAITILGSAAIITAAFTTGPIASIAGLAGIAFLGIAMAGEIHILVIQRRINREKQKEKEGNTLPIKHAYLTQQFAQQLSNQALPVIQKIANKAQEDLINENPSNNSDLLLQLNIINNIIQNPTKELTQSDLEIISAIASIYDSVLSSDEKSALRKITSSPFSGAELTLIADYLQIPKNQRDDFKLHWSGFFQARYGSLE